jgi:transposase
MSKKIFNDKDIQKLQENPYASKGITYTDEFKRLFIAENEGKTSGQIFSEDKVLMWR